MQHNAEISALACSDNFRKREALLNTEKETSIEFCNKQANSHQKAVKRFS